MVGGGQRDGHSLWDRLRGERTVIRFHGDSAHDRFVRWIEENPQGFVINCGPEYWMLHQADCPCFKFDPETDVCLTRNEKVCSLDQAELERWAVKESSAPLQYCSRRPPRW